MLSESATRTYRHALHEMRFVAGCWVIAFLWTVGYCYLQGYQHDPQAWLVRTGLAAARSPDNIRLVGGIPDWVVFGIIAPWLACSWITVLYGMRFMHDDDLGIEGESRGA